jgi:hypothetical protein
MDVREQSPLVDPSLDAFGMCKAGGRASDHVDVGEVFWHVFSIWMWLHDSEIGSKANERRCSRCCTLREAEAIKTDVQSGSLFSVLIPCYYKRHVCRQGGDSLRWQAFSPMLPHGLLLHETSVRLRPTWI